jgi:MFS family permease
VQDPAPGLWRNGAFVRFWTGRSVSIFGSYITRMALPFVAILVLGAGALEVAILRSIDLAVALAFGLFAGAWVDRLRRRPILIWSDLLRALLLGTIPLAHLLGFLTLGQLLVIAGAAALLATFADAADNAYLPSLVERPHLVRANAALEASGSAAEFTGFGLSGFLVQLLTAPIAIVIDAVTFLFSAATLLTIRRPEADPPRREHREPMLGEIRAGLHITFRDPTLRAFAIAQMAQSALWGVFGATWILFATRDLQLGPAAIGVVAAVGGLGSLGGAVLASRVTRRFGVGPASVAAMVIAAGGNLLIPLAPAGAPAVALAFLFTQQLVGDGAFTLYGVTETSVRQAFVHDRALGRVASSFRVAAVLAQLAATITGGLLAEAIGLRGALFVGPIGAALAAAALWFSPVRSLRDLPREPMHGPPPLLAAAQAASEASRDQPVGG